MPDTEELVLDFHVDAPAERLQTWWTNLPDHYEADDPREQPHRIDRLSETEDGGVYRTEWRGPMGLTFSLEETLHVEGPGSWRFVVPGAGFEIVDRYTVQDEGESCHLRIRSTMTYENTLGKLARKAMVPSWKDKFTEVFTNAVAVFEDRHARPETVTGSP